jgi:type II secretory pathway pseudopilin PulG
VIVIIGILAVIVITTFNGAQMRARNIVRIERGKVLYDALANYHILDGGYPDGFGSGLDRYVCMGKNNPDSNGDSVGDCENWGQVHDEDVAFNGAMTGIVNVPDGLQFPYIEGNGGQHFRGIVLVHENTTTIDGIVRSYMTFALEGVGQDCRVAITIIGGPNIYTTGTNTLGFTPAASDITLCNIPFPEKS